MKQTIDARVGKERVVEVLERLGIAISRQGKRVYANFRNERTPSVIINEDGSFYDFGTGDNGTLIDFFMIHCGMELKDAIEETKKALRIESEDISTIKERVQNRTKVQEQNDKETPTPQALKRKMNFFVHLSKKEENRAKFIELLKKVFPSIDDEQKILELADTYGMGFIEQPNPRVVMPIRDENFEIVNLWKYNGGEGEVKVSFEPKCHDVAFPMHRLKEFSKRDEVILVCEGQKDVLNALANGYLAVTSGSAVCTFQEKHLWFFKDKRVAVYGDYGDEGGKTFSKNISEQLKGIAKEVLIIDWERIFKKNGITPKRGYDLTDLLSHKKGTKK